MKKQICLASAIALLVSSNLISAETSVRLNETVISSKGFETLAQNENKNILILDNSDNVKKGYTDISDLFRNAPYVNVLSGLTDNGKILDIRGQGRNAIANTKFLLDEVPIDSLDLSHSQPPIASIPVSSIDKVEIITGGNSILYGNGAIGGVVNVITKAENKKEYAELQALYKSFNTKSLSGGIGRKLNDKTYFSVDFDKTNGDSYKKNDNFNNTFFASSLGYDLTDSQNITFSFRNSTNKGLSTGGASEESLEQDRRQSGAMLTDYDFSMANYALKYSFDINDNFAFKAKVFYQRNDSYLNAVGKMLSGATVININQLTTDDVEVQKGLKLSQQIKYADQQGSFIIGYDLLNRNLIRNSPINLEIKTGGPVVYPDVETYNDFNKQTNSIFAFNKYTIAKVFTIDLGYRFEHASYDLFRHSISNTTSSYNPKPKGEIIEQDSKETSSNHAFSVGINYLLSDSDNLYASFERGFISPSPTQFTNKTQAEVYKDSNIKSQSTNNFEIGYKGYNLGSYISVAGFYTLTDDEIVNTQIENAFSAWSYTNLNKTRRIGAEILLEQEFGRLSLNESFNYIDVKITEGSFKGRRIPLVPNMKATLGVSYEVINGLTLGTDLTYKGKYLESYKTDKEAKGVFTTSINASYQAIDNLNIIAGVDNVFGAEYNLSLDLLNLYIVAPKQTYYVGLQYKF